MLHKLRNNYLVRNEEYSRINALVVAFGFVKNFKFFVSFEGTIKKYEDDYRFI